MTNETGKPIAPTEKPLAQGKRELAAKQPHDKPVANWRVRALAIAGFGALAACGGSAETVELPPTNLPAGVCPDIAARTSEGGEVSLGMNEAMLKLGESANLTDYALVKVSALDETASGTKVTLKLVGEDGRSLANIVDPTDGETIPATSDGLGPGDSWTFVKDGVAYTVTICAIRHTEDGEDSVILTVEPNFDWCAPVDRIDPVETDTFGTNTYGTETIDATVHVTGENPRRTDAECASTSSETITERADLEVPMEPGVQPANSWVKILGDIWEVIELDATGHILLGIGVVSGDVEVGETLVTGVDNLELLVTEVANYDGVYKANLVVSVPGFELELVEGAVAGTLVRISLPSGDVYVRVNAVNADGTVALEVLGQTRVMRNGGIWTEGEADYATRVAKEGSNVTGWALTLQ